MNSLNFTNLKKKSCIKSFLKDVLHHYLQKIVILRSGIFNYILALLLVINYNIAYILIIEADEFSEVMSICEI